MDSADFENAMRAITFPTTSLMMKLVEKQILTEEEAFDVVDVSGSIALDGEVSEAVHKAICHMTKTLEANFKIPIR